MIFESLEVVVPYSPYAIIDNAIFSSISMDIRRMAQGPLLTVIVVSGNLYFLSAETARVLLQPKQND